MIRKVEEIPKDPCQVDKMKLAMDDIRTIIEKRIETSEIVNPVYSESSCYDGYKRAIRKVVIGIAREKGVGYVSAGACFQVIHREIDGQKRWFIVFDAERWDAVWKFIEEMEGKA